eukprot:TRINITY_DN69322_c0_g1_i1.p1 TRINITY_DN69322_c0_g1~~TRINITY_DN69322_c0_g1_i1.p1  ORF type:complete len:560 (-),score=129.93 TRINITY_DN69322_c0_g1_i1:71-1750(-)
MWKRLSQVGYTVDFGKPSRRNDGNQRAAGSDQPSPKADVASGGQAEGGAGSGGGPRDGGVASEEESRQMLLDMGFGEKQVERALHQCGGVASDAALVLLSMPFNDDGGTSPNGDGPPHSPGLLEGTGHDAEEGMAVEDDEHIREVLRLSELEEKRRAQDVDEELEMAIKMSEDTFQAEEDRRRERLAEAAMNQVTPPASKMPRPPSPVGPQQPDPAEVERALQESMRQLHERAMENSVSLGSRPSSRAMSRGLSSPSITLATPASGPLEPRPSSRRLAPISSLRQRGSDGTPGDQDAMDHDPGGREMARLMHEAIGGDEESGSRGSKSAVGGRRGGGGINSRGAGTPLGGEGQRGGSRGDGSRGGGNHGFGTLSRPNSVGSLGIEDLNSFSIRNEAHGGTRISPLSGAPARLANRGRSIEARGAAQELLNGLAACGILGDDEPEPRRSPALSGMKKSSSSSQMSSPSAPAARKYSALTTLAPLNSSSMGLTPNGALIASGQRPMIRGGGSPAGQGWSNVPPLRPGSEASRRNLTPSMASSGSTSLLAAASAALEVRPPR